MIVREMLESDLDTILEIENSIYKDKWNKDTYLNDLVLNNKLEFGFKIDNYLEINKCIQNLLL